MRSLSLLPFLFFIAACGGQAAQVSDDDGGPGDGGIPPGDGGLPDSEQPDVTNPRGIEGSYDLVFTKVDLEHPTPGGRPPSLDHAYRVDIRRVAGNLQAVVTPRWGEPAAYAVDAQPSAIRLTGKGSLSGDAWETISLPREGEGSFTATGTETQSNGDVVYSSKMTGSGSAALDVTSPELLVMTGPPVVDPAAVHLPWDPIVVRAAEPITVQDAAAIKVSGTSGPLAVAWDPVAPDATIDWAGRIQLVARRTSFEPNGALARIAAPPNVGRDLVGLGNAAMDQPMSFLDLAVSAKSHTFDGDVVTVGTWGGAKLLGGKTPAPACETGGCVELEFKAGYCNVPYLGFAARLDAAGASTAKLRYRVLVNAPPGQGGPPQYVPPAFTFDVAPPGGTVQHNAHNVAPAELKALATPVLGYAYATDWATLAAPIAKPGENGVAVYAGTGPLGPSCGFVPGPVPIAVLLDAVTAE